MKLKEQCSDIYLNIIHKLFDSKTPTYNKLNRLIENVIKNKYFINNSLRMTAIE